MRFGAYGLRIDSAVRLPAPSGDSGPADVTITLGAVDLAGVTFPPLHAAEDIWLDKGWDDGRVVLRFDDLAAELMLDEPVIRVDDSRVGDVDLLAHLVLDHVLPQWLGMRGHAVLHAGAVAVPGGPAVAFIGDSGRGKSSTTTGLAGLGWAFLADDACLLEPGDGAHVVVPGYPGVRLLHESRLALTPDSDSQPMAVGAAKHRVVPDVPISSAPVSLGLVVELGEDTSDITAQRLSFADATASLARHSFYLASTADGVASQTFRLASEVAAETPVVRMSFPRRWDVFADLAVVIQGELA